MISRPGGVQFRHDALPAGWSLQNKAIGGPRSSAGNQPISAYLKLEPDGEFSELATEVPSFRQQCLARLPLPHEQGEFLDGIRCSVLDVQTTN